MLKNRLSPRGAKEIKEREIETGSDVHMPMSNLKKDKEGA